MRLAYNTSDRAIKVICTLLPAVQARVSIHGLRQSLRIQKISKVVLSTLSTAFHHHTLDICRISVCTCSTRSPDKCAKPHEAIKLQFLTLMETQVKPTDVNLKGQRMQSFLRENINHAKTRQVRVNSKRFAKFDTRKGAPVIPRHAR